MKQKSMFIHVLNRPITAVFLSLGSMTELEFGIVGSAR